MRTEKLRALLEAGTDQGEWGTERFEEDGEERLYIRGNGWYIARLSLFTPAGEEANAALIAGAVNALPALLDIAEAAAGFLGCWNAIGTLGAGEVSDAAAALRAALDRYEKGESE